MLTVRTQVIDGTGTFTLSDSQPCRLLTPLLGFSAGEEIIDMVRAVVAQRGHGVERPIAVISPGDRASIRVITFDPFEESDQAKMIKARVYWRTATRKTFSRSSVASK